MPRYMYDGDEYGSGSQTALEAPRVVTRTQNDTVEMNRLVNNLIMRLREVTQENDQLRASARRVDLDHLREMQDMEHKHRVEMCKMEEKTHAMERNHQGEMCKMMEKANEKELNHQKEMDEIKRKYEGDIVRIMRERQEETAKIVTANQITMEKLKDKFWEVIQVKEEEIGQLKNQTTESCCILCRLWRWFLTLFQ